MFIETILSMTAALLYTMKCFWSVYYLLFKEREVDHELRTVDHALKMEIILASVEWERFFVLKGDLVDLIAECQTIALF